MLFIDKEDDFTVIHAGIPKPVMMMMVMKRGVAVVVAYPKVKLRWITLFIDVRMNLLTRFLFETSVGRSQHLNNGIN